MASTVYFLLFAGFIISIIHSVTSESWNEWDFGKSYTDEDRDSRDWATESPELSWTRKPVDCPTNEHYDNCRAHDRCQKNCDNYNKTIPCPAICVSGCICDEGFIRGPDKRCIRPESCPAKENAEGQNCPTNEHFDQCGAHPLCQQNCENYPKPIPCTMACISGCICDKGLIRGPDNKCIRPETCPAKPNAEEWDVERSYTDEDHDSRDWAPESSELTWTRKPHDCPTHEHYDVCQAYQGCQKNCDNYKENKPCPLICVSGCICDEGLIRGPDKKCIRPESCPAKENAEEWDVERSYTDEDHDSRDWATASPEFTWTRKQWDVERFYTDEDHDSRDWPTIKPEICPENEHHHPCQSHCQKNCNNYKENKPCPMICVPGCICDEGLIRGPDNKCIRPDSCPAKPNAEEWDVERSSEYPLSITDDEYYFSDWTTESPVSPFSQRHRDCKANEHFTKCDFYCQKTCDNYKEDRPCPRFCLGGCVCDEGFVRGPDKKCVKPEICPAKPNAKEWDVERSSVNPLSYTDEEHYSRDWATEIPVSEFSPRSQTCPTNEHFDQCGAHPLCQQNCENYPKPIPCTMACISGCICDEGFIRGPDNKCIRPETCPAKPNAEAQSQKCPTNEHFDQCGAHPLCQQNCDNYPKPIPCTMACISGCICDEGFIRGPDNKCIRPETCPAKPNAEEWDVETSSINPRAYTLYSRDRTTESPDLAVSRRTPNCSTNEHFDVCQGHPRCQDNCDNYKNRVPCPLFCVSGCVCDEGLIRGPGNNCIKPETCPAKAKAKAQRLDCPANEHYSRCDANCQKTCDNYKKPIPCPKTCIWGCVCDMGLVRGPENRCIRPKSCPAKPNAEAQHFYVTLNPPPYTDDDYHIPDSVTENPNFVETEILPTLKPKPAHQCPGPRERWVPCGGHCQRNCTNKDDKDFGCRPVCIPGCICEQGFVKGPDGKCIEKDKCPPKSDSEGSYDFPTGGNPCPSDEACGKLCRNINGMKAGRCIGPNKIACQCY